MPHRCQTFKSVSPFITLIMVPIKCYYSIAYSMFPISDDPIDNNRYKCMKFKCNTSNVLVHGLAGYFDTVLYKDVMLSE